MENKVIRGFDVLPEGGVKAWTREEFVNKDGRLVTRETTEVYKTYKEVMEVVNTDLPMTRANIMQQLEDTKKGIQKMQGDIKQVVNTREYLQYKAFQGSDVHRDYEDMIRREKESRSVEIFFTLYDKEEYEKYKKERDGKQNKDFYLVFQTERNLEAHNKKLPELEAAVEELKDAFKQFEGMAESLKPLE